MTDVARTLEGKRVLVTGGTGSLGERLVARILGGERGRPARVVVYSRDEAKQHEMRLAFAGRAVATDEVIYASGGGVLDFRIGDVRDRDAFGDALAEADVVFHAAALKQVPTCERFPVEAVRTNVDGAANLVAAIGSRRLPIEAVVGISTDKACLPINVMGMTKALSERILLGANGTGETAYVCVRYGNVVGSRGSVVPLFERQIAAGGPLTLTDARMTRFLMSLDEAVDAVLETFAGAQPGETWVPRPPAARMVDVARAMIGDRPIEIVPTHIRPGEKLDETLVSAEEALHTVSRGGFHVIGPVATNGGDLAPPLDRPFRSSDDVLDAVATRALLVRLGVVA